MRAERSIGEPLARATNSDESARALLALGRLLRAGLEVGGGVATRGLHLAGLPARRDVQRLEVKVDRLGRTIEELAHTVDETGRDGVGGRR